MAVRTAVVLALVVVAVLTLQGCPKPAENAPPVESPKLQGTQSTGTVAAANSDATPVADAKALFETKCSKCHQSTKAAKHPGDAAHWTETVKDMASKKPGWISDAEVAKITAYCCAAYPK